MNLNTSLRSTTLRQYTIELSNLEKIELRNNPRDIEEQYNILLFCFKDLSSVALLNLTLKKYTTINTYIKREPVDYV